METTMCVKCQRETIRLRTGQCMACAGDEFLVLCTHRNMEGQCDRCAADADCARKAADYDRLAGEVERLTRERDEARDAARRMLKRAETAEGSTVSWAETAAAETARTQAAEARAEALTTAAKKAVSSIKVMHDLCDRLMGDSDLDGDPDAKIMARALKVAERLNAALATTPPADLTQKPCPCDGEGCEGTSDGLRHQCGGPAEACCVPGCGECGTPADLTQHPAPLDWKEGVRGRGKGRLASAFVAQLGALAVRVWRVKQGEPVAWSVTGEASSEDEGKAAVERLLATKEVRDGE